MGTLRHRQAKSLAQGGGGRTRTWLLQVTAVHHHTTRDSVTLSGIEIFPSISLVAFSE